MCGFEYTSKLQRMFNDMATSKDLNDNFRTHLTNTTPLKGKPESFSARLITGV